MSNFQKKWGDKYLSISNLWTRKWEYLISIFDYPDEIRKVIKNKRIFPNDTRALKMVYLAIKKASKKWTMPIRDWKSAMNQFQIQYGNRLIAD